MKNLEAITILKNLEKVLDDYCELNDDGKVAFNMAITALERVDNSGYWIEIDDYYNRIRGRCSVCGWESHMYDDDVVGMDFCPNCGARLLQEGDETGCA